MTLFNTTERVPLSMRILEVEKMGRDDCVKGYGVSNKGLRNKLSDHTVTLIESFASEVFH